MAAGDRREPRLRSSLFSIWGTRWIPAASANRQSRRGAPPSLDPKQAPTLWRAAWVLATDSGASVPSGAEALRLADRAARLAGGDSGASRAIREEYGVYRDGAN